MALTTRGIVLTAILAFAGSFAVIFSIIHMIHSTQDEVFKMYATFVNSFLATLIVMLTILVVENKNRDNRENEPHNHLENKPPE